MNNDDTNPDEKTRYANGMTTRKAVLGADYVEAATARTTDFTSDFQAFITRTAWNDVWNRPGLDRRARSIAVLSITVGLRHWGEFRVHVRAAFNNGLTKDEIKEILIQAAVYAGVPAANHAFKEAESVFAEMGI
jgi:4-carboxymuconolactone decarboxylase